MDSTENLNENDIITNMTPEQKGIFYVSKIAYLDKDKFTSSLGICLSAVLTAISWFSYGIDPERIGATLPIIATNAFLYFGGKYLYNKKEGDIINKSLMELNESEKPDMGR